MAGRRDGSDVSAKGLTYSQPAKYSVEVLRPEVTELDVRSQQVRSVHSHKRRQRTTRQIPTGFQ